ncbi:MAG: FAD-dependent oxidoreductase [Proteobacteria bacterium]|nr:FAD-dependent oxidoreductase [Pseudomonadota bacterium]
MKRIAVVGSGISGLAAAFMLSQRAHVTLYEKGPVAGGHSRTVTVNCKGRKIPVDTGFMVFNHATYPNLTGLFDTLKVSSHKSDMSFSFSMDQGAFEWSGKNLDAMFATRRNILSPAFHRMILDVMRFFRNAENVVTKFPSLTLEGLLDEMRLGQQFRDRFLLPMGAAIWSNPASQMLAFPAASFVHFFRNHGLLSFTGQHQWYTVTGGSSQYVERILRPVQDVRLSTSVAKIDTSKPRPAVTTRDGERLSFDDVVLANHADEALALIDAPTDKERAVLGAFKYQENVTWLHSDETVMPRRRSCWASWNYHATASERVSVTYWMNLLQGIARDCPLFVTLNPDVPIAPDRVLDKHSFSHPIFTGEAIAAQGMIPSIQGARHLWFCGAYQRNGFHEDGLQSAVNVAQALGGMIPWR